MKAFHILCFAPSLYAYWSALPPMAWKVTMSREKSKVGHPDFVRPAILHCYTDYSTLDQIHPD